MEVRVDSHLRIDPSTMPGPVRSAVLRSLEFVDPDDPERIIRLWSMEDDDLLLPRGFAHRLVTGCAKLGARVRFVDERVRKAAASELRAQGTLFPYQEPAAARMLKVEQGIYQAPPGSGKTITALDVIRRSGQRSIVIVNTSNVLRQWIERCEQFLGYTPGIVGDGEWDERDLTIATQQTLWSRREKLDAEGWWWNWGLVLEDEIHHVTADTFDQIIQRFPARYRLGVSATPDKDNGYFKRALSSIGEIVHLTTKADMREAGRLVMPEIEIVRTRFEYAWGDKSDDYKRMVDAIIDDDERNDLIASIVMENRGKANMVLSTRLGHLDTLRECIADKGWPATRLWMLTGNETSHERMKVSHDVEAHGDCVVFASQVADEAVDIPRMDRLYLCAPSRNAKTIVQRIGRIERVHPDKADARVYDFVDWSVGVCHRQYRHRAKNVYVPEGYPLTTRREKEGKGG